TYWQQHVDYKMEVEMNVEDWTYSGKQILTFTNNSPDTLNQVFYHLYFNAFKPGSMMDVRSQELPDPDRRVDDKIGKLEPNEYGILEPKTIRQDGKKLDFDVRETILQVPLKKPILPGAKTVLEMDFHGQVPPVIRRAGRNSREGIDLSMAQWYPKLCNYDHDGWHPNPYIGREFYGIWGDFDVKITIDAQYILGATGYLQNANEIGYGYQDDGVEVDHTGKDKLTWHFVAPQVHDFVWAADPEYNHFYIDTDEDLRLHFLFKGVDSTMVRNWYNLAGYTTETFAFANKHFGKYPYKQYSVIQGGDGGMEYPMATLITGRRSFGSLVGVTVHEVMHSWYQMLLATHELLYPWMDEGFTSYASEIIMNHLFDIEEEPREMHQRAYAGYLSIAGTAEEDPLTMHGDHYQSNRAYGIAAYNKGQVYLHQLSYIIGQKTLDRVLLRYFNEWKFKHPRPNDFLRIAEKESNMILDWYHNYFVNTTEVIDYAIRSLEQRGNQTLITLERYGRMPMPVELVIRKKNGKDELHYIPMEIMYGRKKHGKSDVKVVDCEPWRWTNPTYIVTLPYPATDIRMVEIDPSYRMADVDRSNNLLLIPEGVQMLIQPVAPNR
ncbi:MAG: M1 family peptidase, partial [Cryomorphaceae bacterium]